MCTVLMLGRLPPSSSTHGCTWVQGVAPLGLSRVPTEELARFIAHCIAPRDSRPRARQLLKNTYFDSIRTEKCAVRLSVEALANAGASSAGECL